MKEVQKNVSRWEGAVNKMLVDDKGTLIVVSLGLPPRPHPDDPVHKPLTELLGITHPIFLAGMNVAAGPKLAAAVTNAGGKSSASAEQRKRCSQKAEAS